MQPELSACMQGLRAFIAMVAMTTCSNGIAVEITSIEVSVIGDSNPAKAQFDGDIESTNSVRFGFDALLFSRELNNGDVVELDARAAFESNSSIEQLGESTYAAGVVYFKNIEEALGSPMLSFRGEVAFLDSETDIRDSGIFGLAVTGNWQPAPFFDFSLGTRLDVRAAATEVFDTRKLQLFGMANFSPTRRTSFRSGLSLVFGNEVSSSRPTVAIVNNSDAIEPDNAFGGFDDRRFAYLLDANSIIFELGAFVEITPQIFGDLRYRFIHTDADDPIDYDRQLVTLSLQYALR